MEKLKLAAGMTGEQKRYAVEAALLLGFQTETATFPVITADGEIPVPENMEELKALWKKSTGGTPEEYESASKHTGPIFDLDFRKEKGLETKVVDKANGMASMPLETIAKSLEYCVEAVVNNTEDVKEVMGTTH